MEEKTFVGYHTTDIDSLNSIMQNGFEMSEPMSKHWLGRLWICRFKYTHGIWNI